MSRTGSRGIPSALGPGGGSRPGAGGAVTVLLQMQAEQEGKVAKLLQIMEKMQLENQRTIQEAGQAGSQAAMNVANQITRGIEQQNQQTQRQQERAEDKEFAESQQRLNAKLQSDATREAASMGEAIKGQRDAITRYRNSFLAKKASTDEAIAAYSARTDEMLSAGWFSSPEGRKELKQRVHLISMMQANADDHFDDRHLSAAYRMHNKNVQVLISREGRGMDLSSMQVDPLQLPMANTKDSGRPIAKAGSISPEKMFEMKLYGGYPKNGVIFNEEENFGMPPGYSPRVGDADTVLEALARDDYIRYATDQSIRQEMERKQQEIVVQSLDRLEPLKEQYENFNRTFNPMAPNAVERALENFLAEDNPNKFNDMGRTITSNAIMEMFGGGKQGEEMAIIAMELFDGKREMKTPEEMFAAMALESAVFNVKEHMLNEFMTTDEAGQGLATQLVRQMVDELGEEQASLALGVPQTGVGLVRAQEVMQGRLAEAYSFANRMHEGLWKSSALEQFRGDLRKYTRLADLYSFKVLKDGENTQERVLNLMDQDDALAAVSDQISGASPDEIAAGGQRDASKVKVGLSMFDAMIEISDGLGPDTLRETAAFITGGLEPIDTPNLNAYLDQTRVEHARSGYGKAASVRASFNFKRNERAKTADKRRQQAQESIGESFSRGGAIGVVSEQVPPLLSLAGRGVVSGIERTAIGVVQTVAGRGPAESVLRSKRQLESGISGFVGKHTNVVPGTSTQNLTPEERTQVIDESQRGF